MNQNQIDQELKGCHIRPTSIRRDILHIFSEQPFTLSHADLEKYTAGNYDRVTIYRTLDLFLEKGLIHKVLDDSGIARYALGSGREHKTGIESEHLHFKCKECGKTICLDNVEIPDFHFPADYKINTLNITVEGICGPCNHTA